MNFYQKWWQWFRNQPRWLQTSVIVGVCVILVVGIWLSSTSYSGDSAAQMVDSTGWMISVFLKLVLVLMLILCAAVVVKRWTNGTVRINDRKMQVVETLTLNPKRALHIIRVGDQSFLIGATDQNITLIQELEPIGTMVSFKSAFEQAAVLQEKDQ
jgi:flagellar biosynthetic protein FliO